MQNNPKYLGGGGEKQQNTKNPQWFFKKIIPIRN